MDDYAKGGDTLGNFMLLQQRRTCYREPADQLKSGAAFIVESYYSLPAL